MQQRRCLIGNLAHEIGHTLGLNHPTWCGNECAGIDINPVVECEARCTTNPPQLCADQPFDFGGPKVCAGNTRLCGGCSNNLTGSCGSLIRSITPCQWRTIFNDVLYGKSKYALLCFTASTFSLSQSPLNDYRASQSITSTSVIQGDRQVDYWSPTITLNPGFEVKKGTGFVAAPTTFPCCTTANGGGLPNGYNSDNPVLDVQNEALTVIPNPFGESVNINYEVAEDFDNNDMNIIDISGRVVKNIRINSQSKGRYQIELKTSDLSNGIYFIRYKSKNQVLTKKIVKTSSN